MSEFFQNAAISSLVTKRFTKRCMIGPSINASCGGWTCFKSYWNTQQITHCVQQHDSTKKYNVKTCKLLHLRGMHLNHWHLWRSNTDLMSRRKWMTIKTKKIQNFQITHTISQLRFQPHSVEFRHAISITHHRCPNSHTQFDNNFKSSNRNSNVPNNIRWPLTLSTKFRPQLFFPNSPLLGVRPEDGKRRRAWTPFLQANCGLFVPLLAGSLGREQYV